MLGWRVGDGVRWSEARMRMPFGDEGAGGAGLDDALVLELELRVVMEPAFVCNGLRVKVLIELYAPGERDCTSCTAISAVSSVPCWRCGCGGSANDPGEQSPCADGRFVALATRRRTVHVFAVNPYGGQSVAGGEDAPKEVPALVRMRLPAAPQGEDAVPPAPLAVAFVPPAASTPAHSLHSPDVLVFNPVDGVLSLRRVTVALEVTHGAGCRSRAWPSLWLGLGAAGRGG
ncbi:hypothetical protein FB451DRAFT_1487195 [Mycena latifolia]|nr:hypothetical protein FB451DRAFT_1487195 [Mycena latifolia]